MHNLRFQKLDVCSTYMEKLIIVKSSPYMQTISPIIRREGSTKVDKFWSKN